MLNRCLLADNCSPHLFYNFQFEPVTLPLVVTLANAREVIDAFGAALAHNAFLVGGVGLEGVQAEWWLGVRVGGAVRKPLLLPWLLGEVRTNHRILHVHHPTA